MEVKKYRVVGGFLKILFTYLFVYLFIGMRNRERLRVSTSRAVEAEAEGEAGSPRSREPDAGLDPRTPGSRPEPNADAQLLSQPGILTGNFLKQTSKDIILSIKTRKCVCMFL